MDLDGKIMGISTAIIPFAQGIGFAIPSNSAKSCTYDMTTAGVSRTPWLGVIGLSLNAQVARYYGLPVDHGVLVTKVAEGSPADKAEMLDGDIILEIDNIEVRRIEDLVEEIHKRKVGDTVRILAIRDRREHFFETRLSETP